MSQTSIDPQKDQDKLSVAVARVLWKGKWWIGFLTAVGALIGVAVALILPNIFRAEALLQVRQMSPSAGNLGGLASLAAQFGGLASGGVLSLANGTDRDVALATLSSRVVVEALIRDKDLLPKLYASKWDSKGGKWKTADVEKQPTVWQAYNDFTRDVLRVTEDRRTGLIRISVDWKNPEEAEQWVTELVARTNSYLRERAIREGQKNLEYLRTQAQQIGQVELVQALYGLVEDEMKRMMVANVGDEFALKTVDPAVVPKKRNRPNRALIALVGLFVGGALGVAMSVMRAS